MNESPTFTPLTPHIGSRVEGIDLRHAVPDTVFDTLCTELWNRSLLVLPSQSLDPAHQVDFSRRFGELEHHVLQDFCLQGFPEIYVVSNIIEHGKHVGAYGGSKQFHSDLSYMAEPSLGSLFYCLECPAEGGETAFASMFAAYDALPAERKRWLEAHDAIHDYVWHHNRRMQHRPPLTQAQLDATPLVSHPAVRVHPVNGRRALFISELLTRTFEGVDEQEARALITELDAFATGPEFVYVHRWTPGDLVIWDNRSSMHKAMPFDEENARRRMHRTTVCGEPLVRVAA